MAGSRRIAGIAGAALMAACAAEEPGIDVPPPPPTEVREVVDTLHGVEVPDPYRWLEDQEAPETRAWIDAQNAHTDTVLNALPGREELRAVAASVLERDAIGLPNERGDAISTASGAPTRIWRWSTCARGSTATTGC